MIWPRLNVSLPTVLLMVDTACHTFVAVANEGELDSIRYPEIKAPPKRYNWRPMAWSGFNTPGITQAITFRPRICRVEHVLMGAGYPSPS